MDARKLLTEGRHALARADLPGLEAEILLGYVLGRNRAWFYANPEAEVSEADVSHYRALLHRRRDGEPVAYLTGVREFWSMVLTVTPDVLIPRPETECLVEAVLPFLDNPGRSPQRVLDMGTGSGAIIIALAHEHPEHRYVAMDRSVPALNTARQNARTHQVDHCINWFCGNWNAALAAASASSGPGGPYSAGDGTMRMGSGSRSVTARTGSKDMTRNSL